MILTLKGEPIGEVIKLPTLQEMRRVKSQIGISNPMIFMLKATQLDSPEFDADAFAMLYVLMKARAGVDVDFDTLELDFSDIGLEQVSSAESRSAAQPAPKRRAPAKKATSAAPAASSGA